MRFVCWKLLFCTAVVLWALPAQELTPKDPIGAIDDAFSSRQLVMLGDMHGNVQEHRVLLDLIESPGFSRVVSDIVIEGGNARYQPLVDRYVAGENVPVEQLEPVWRDGLAIGPVADEPEIELFETVRKTNRTLPAGRPKLRIICGEAAEETNRNAHISGSLAENGDAFLFLGPRDELKQFLPKRSALVGTEYGKETERRLGIIFGEARKPDFLPKDNSGVAPQYSPPNDQHH